MKFQKTRSSSEQAVFQEMGAELAMGRYVTAQKLRDQFNQLSWRSDGLLEKLWSLHQITERKMS